MKSYERPTAEQSTAGQLTAKHTEGTGRIEESPVLPASAESASVSLDAPPRSALGKIGAKVQRAFSRSVNPRYDSPTAEELAEYRAAVAEDVKANPDVYSPKQEDINATIAPYIDRIAALEHEYAEAVSEFEGGDDYEGALRKLGELLGLTLGLSFNPDIFFDDRSMANRGCGGDYSHNSGLRGGEVRIMREDKLIWAIKNRPGHSYDRTMIERLAHELWHARQYDQVDCAPDAPQSQKYDINLSSYLDAETYGRKAYSSQLVEREAFTFGKAASRLIMSAGLKSFPRRHEEIKKELAKVNPRPIRKKPATNTQ